MSTSLDEMLLLGQPKQSAQNVVRYVGEDDTRFSVLMDLLFGKDNRLVQRAAHAISHCIDANPALIQPYITKLIDNLGNDPDVAVRRNTLRILQSQQIPESHQGTLYEICFKYLTSSSEPIAVKAFSMTVLSNLADLYPDLKNELIPIIKDLISTGSAGIKSRGRKVLKALGQT